MNAPKPVKISSSTFFNGLVDRFQHWRDRRSHHFSHFCRLCKIKYYNNALFYNVQRNFLLQTGDPTNTGKGGDSIWGVLYGEQARFFDDEIKPQLKHKKRGMVGMASKFLC